jgi:Zn-dependent protease
MNTKRFFLAWILSALVMFSLSYLWHGVFLNDLQRLSYPKEIFLTGSIITYLILGFLVTKIYLMKYPKAIARKPLIRGLISGAALGMCTYIVSLVVGVSFNNSLTLGNILFDFSWQTLEQTSGGVSVAFIYIWIYEGNPVEVIGRKMFGD